MKPKIGLLLGDRNGIGPEIAAKLLSRPETLAAADVVVIADRGVFDAGQAVAGVTLPDNLEFRSLESPANETRIGTATASAGQEVLDGLLQAGRMAQAKSAGSFSRR